jgi:TPR repeat protein
MKQKIKILLLFALLQLPVQLFADYGNDMATKASSYIKNNNYTDAKYYLEKASDSGDAWSMQTLGWMYLNGVGVSVDYAKAKKYLTDASDKDNTYAKYQLGFMYLYGKGTDKDYTKAKQYFKEASDKDNIEAKFYLGLMHLNGLGVTKDYKSAKKYFEESSNSGNMWSKYQLGEIYFNGYGVTKDYIKAKVYYMQTSEDDGLKEASKEMLVLIDKNIAKESDSDNIALLLKETKQKKVSDTKYLIVIGAENYEYTDNIVYSQHTAQMFLEVAQKTLGISQSNTLDLTSENASMSRIQMEMNKLLRRVKNGDTIYFYYSGHGIPVATQKNEPYILPIDVEPEFISEAPFFKLQNIYKTLADSKASKVVAFIDSCFSGATDGVSVIKGVAATRLKAKNVTFDTKKMVVLTAGKDKQYSNMYEAKKYRLFSYFLMESMLKGRTSVKDIYSDLYIKVKDESYKMGDMKLQEPTMSGNTGIKL